MSKITETVAKKRAAKEQDSVTGTFARGKRDPKTGVIDTTWVPSGNGGFRFEDENGRGFSPVYLSPEEYKSIGSPARIRRTIKAL